MQPRSEFLCPGTLEDDDLTPEEWSELIGLKDAISHCPSQVHTNSLERFSQLFAKSLAGKGDPAC